MPDSGHFLFSGNNPFHLRVLYTYKTKIRTDRMNTVLAVSTIFLFVLFGAIMAIGLKKDPGNDK